jgi:hypothetical protein
MELIIKVMKPIFVFLTIIFFYLYFKILNFIFNEFIPLSPSADIASMWILFIIISPLSVYSADKIIKTIKNS